MVLTVLIVMVAAGLFLVGRSAIAMIFDRAPRHPRCIRCGYDLSGTRSLVCPECGHQHVERAQMLRHRPRPGGLGCGLVLLIVGILALAAFTQGRPWFALVPRPILRLALQAVAPPLSPVPPGATLPPSPPQPPWNANDWDRLVWSYQVGQVMRAWGDAVITNEPGIPEARLDGLMAAADQVEALYEQTGVLPYQLAWPTEDAHASVQRAGRRAAAERRTNSDDPTLVRFDSGAWALAELQYNGDYSHRSDWATVPDDLLLHMLTSTDAGRRTWAIRRLNRKQPGVDRLRPVLDAIIRADPDPKIRKTAQEMLGWLQMGDDDRWRAAPARPPDGKP